MCLELACLAALAHEATLSAYNVAGGNFAASGALAAAEALGYTAAAAGAITAAAGAIVLLYTARYAFRRTAGYASRPQKCAAPASSLGSFDSPGSLGSPGSFESFDPLARLAQLDRKVELIAASLEAITGVYAYYAAPGGMKLHASIDCILLSHSRELATLTVSPDVRAFLLRAQVVCLRCGHEAPH